MEKYYWCKNKKQHDSDMKKECICHSFFFELLTKQIYNPNANGCRYRDRQKPMYHDKIGRVLSSEVLVNFKCVKLQN